MKFNHPVLKMTNDKWSVRTWILQNYPEGYEQMTYVEPYGGSANMVFSKNKSKFEVINDQDQELVNIYRALRDETSELCKRLTQIKPSALYFDKAKALKNFDDYLDEAANQIFLRKSSVNGAKEKFSKSCNLNSWKKCVSEIADYGKRMKDVFLLNMSALEVIDKFNSDDSFIYCDPPYLYENKVSKVVYSSEMTPDCHMKLYQLLESFKGKVILSGCMSPLYKRIYKNWNIEKTRVNNTKGSSAEIVWKNF